MRDTITQTRANAWLTRISCSKWVSAWEKTMTRTQRSYNVGDVTTMMWHFNVQIRTQHVNANFAHVPTLIKFPISLSLSLSLSFSFIDFTTHVCFLNRKLNLPEVHQKKLNKTEPGECLGLPSISPVLRYEIVREKYRKKGNG